MNDDDTAYLDTLFDINRELRQIILDHETKTVGLVGRDTLVSMWLQENEVLAEAVHRHNRVLRHLLGLPVEPMAHSASAVLVGVMGGSP